MFNHKVLLGWINDVSTQPRIGKRWPMIDVDEQLRQDYHELFGVLKDWGYDGLAIWGLIVNHSWPVNLDDSLTAERRHFLQQVIEDAHEHGLRIYSGLGLYSWGFEEIIRAHPETAKDEGRIVWDEFQPDNGVAMCYHSEAAREWMRKVVDFVFEAVEIDGAGMQSADQGRCYCKQCREMGDMEYHALVNDEWAGYIKSRWPSATVAVSGWGMSFNKVEDIPHLQRLGRHLDYIVDVRDQAGQAGSEFRRNLISSLPCDFGSLGGTTFVPPQRWERFRWFLPHAGLTGGNLQQLYKDGGRAHEFFAGPLVNPQYELMTKFTGYLLNHPETTIEQALAVVVNDVFAPQTKGVEEGIVQWLLAMEAAFFDKATPTYGEFDFEPLMGMQPGDPTYLRKLPNAYLSEYRNSLQKLGAELQSLAKNCRKPQMIGQITRCLSAVSDDVEWSIRHKSSA